MDGGLLWLNEMSIEYERYSNHSDDDTVKAALVIWAAAELAKTPQRVAARPEWRFE